MSKRTSLSQQASLTDWPEEGGGSVGGAHLLRLAVSLPPLLAVHARERRVHIVHLQHRLQAGRQPDVHTRRRQRAPAGWLADLRVWLCAAAAAGGAHLPCRARRRTCGPPPWARPPRPAPPSGPAAHTHTAVSQCDLPAGMPLRSVLPVLAASPARAALTRRPPGSAPVDTGAGEALLAAARQPAGQPTRSIRLSSCSIRL